MKIEFDWKWTRKITWYVSDGLTLASSMLAIAFVLAMLLLPFAIGKSWVFPLFLVLGLGCYVLGAFLHPKIPKAVLIDGATRLQKIVYVLQFVWGGMTAGWVVSVLLMIGLAIFGVVVLEGPTIVICR